MMYQIRVTKVSFNNLSLTLWVKTRNEFLREQALLLKISHLKLKYCQVNLDALALFNGLEILHFQGCKVVTYP